MNTDTRHIFLTLQKKSIQPSLYAAKMQLLIESDPYFFPAYRDLFWYFEEQSNYQGIRMLAEKFFTAVRALCLDKSAQKKQAEMWSQDEKGALLTCIIIFNSTKGVAFLKKFQMNLFKNILEDGIQPKIITTVSKDGQYLRLVKKIDVSKIQTELHRLSSVWWELDTRRSNVILHHQNTHSILLRVLNVPSSSDNLSTTSYSMEGAAAPLLPNVHDTILGIAEELKLSLGRVAIVKLKPRSQVYRHYDSEKHFEFLDRYHLVVTCGQNNILESGTQRVCAEEGELWFFENQIMHRAENDSDKERIHIIFDGFKMNKE